MSTQGPGALPQPPWRRPRALLLDAMGTLIDLRQSVGRIYADVASEHGRALEAMAIDRAFGPIYRGAPPLAFPGLAGAALEDAERGWWAARIDAVLEAIGEDRGTPALHRHLFDRFADPQLWRVPDDVPASLERWRGQGLRLAVVSNFDTRLETLLQGLGLAPWLDAVVISSQVGSAKPSPAPFTVALERLGVHAEEAWHIGDSPEDAAGARAAGLPCLLVRRP